MNVGFNVIFVISTAAVNVFLHFHVFTHNLSPELPLQTLWRNLLCFDIA